MEVHAKVWVELPLPVGIITQRPLGTVSVQLSGSYEGIVALLQKLKWDENIAQELKLE